MSLWDDFRQNQRPKIVSEKIAIFPRRGLGKNCKTLKSWLWVFSATDNLKNLKLHHIDDDLNMSLWDDFRQYRRPKVFSEKIANFPRRGPGKNCKTLKTWLWLFSAIDNLKNVELHHIYDNLNMSLWDDFRQNQRSKIVSEKIAIFPRRGFWFWVLGFLSNRQPEEWATSPHRLWPQHESMGRFQSKSKTKSF